MKLHLRVLCLFHSLGFFCSLPPVYFCVSLFCLSRKLASIIFIIFALRALFLSFFLVRPLNYECCAKSQRPVVSQSRYALKRLWKVTSLVSSPASSFFFRVFEEKSRKLSLSFSPLCASVCSCRLIILSPLHPPTPRSTIIASVWKARFFIMRITIISAGLRAVLY